MADDADRADIIINENLENTLKVISAELNKTNNLKYCVDCDDEITKERREASKNTKRCVQYQTDFERGK